MEPAEDGTGQMQSTVQIEPDLDDHEIHKSVLIDFLSSDTGQDLKADNPGAYANCLAHLQAHNQFMQSLAPPIPGGQGQVKPIGAPAPPRPQPEKNIA